MKDTIEQKINHEVNSSAAEDCLRKCFVDKGRIDQFETINISTGDANSKSMKLSLVRLEMKMDSSFSQLNDKLDILQGIIEAYYWGSGSESPTLKANDESIDSVDVILAPADGTNGNLNHGR